MVGSGEPEPQPSLAVAVEAIQKTWAKDLQIQRYKGLGEMDADQLAETTMDPRHRLLRRISLGDMRLVAWTDAPLTGLEIRPRARQAFHRTLIVAHLKYGNWPEPLRDANTRREVDAEDSLWTMD